MATASGDSTVKIWSIDGKELQTLKGHSSYVTSVAFSPDSKQLATASGDNTVKIWSIDGKELQNLNNSYAYFIGSVAFSPDGKQLASARGNTIKLWNLDDVKLKGLACYWLQDYISAQPDLKKKLATCLDPEILKASASILVSEARTKGMSGKLEDAVFLFQEAKKLDRSISLDPRTEINSYFIPKGERLAKEGDIKAALVAYDQAIKHNPNIKISAASWDTLCWYGSIYNSASQVILACDKAVNLEPDNLDIRDSRAVAKALAGNTNGAISEIEVMLPKIYRQNLESFLAIKEREYPSIAYSEQQRRLDDLKEGKNPFTDEKLEEWRQQAKKDRDS